MSSMSTGPKSSAKSAFSPELMHAAAHLYYEQDATQAQVAERLGTSRPTVSRLLSEARRLGVVRIEVIAPADAHDLAEHTVARLGLEVVRVVPSGPPATLGARLAPALTTALRSADLRPGDGLLVSSGRTVHACAQADLPDLPGVVIAPAVGGQDEPEAWNQTNEIARQVAAKVGGRPSFLYAPVRPSPPLYDKLLEDPDTAAVLTLWQTARCALVGIGAPPSRRGSLPGGLSPTDPVLAGAVGDICARFYDRSGAAVSFPGWDRLLSSDREQLRSIPTTIALACGPEKVESILAGARGGWFNQLIIDTSTAAALLAHPS